MVNAYSEVAHNYRREHGLNMWFVLATETPEAIITLHAIEQTELRVYNFPKQQEFYIGLWLHLAADGRHTTVPVPTQDHTENNRLHLDDIDRKLISVTQTGITIDRSPYQESPITLASRSRMYCSDYRRC